MIAGFGLLLALMLLPFTGGHIRAIGRLSLRNEAAIISVFAAQAVLRGRLPGMAATEWAVSIWGMLCLILLLLLLRNLDVPGIAVVCLGIALNLGVTLLNGGMPYVLPGGSPNVDAGAFYRAASDSTSFVWLADVLPDPSGGWLLSTGDLLLLVGLIAVVVSSGRCYNAKDGLRA